MVYLKLLHCERILHRVHPKYPIYLVSVVRPVAYVLVTAELVRTDIHPVLHRQVKLQCPQQSQPLP